MKELSFSKGDTYLYYGEIYEALSYYLKTDIDSNLYDEAISELDGELKIKIDDDKYYIYEEYEAEEYIANHTHFEKTHLQIIESKGKFRISAAGFNKYKEALQYMDSVRNDVPIAKNAWIMCK
jgi:tetratricopeptide (TPR) repeat protein